MSSIVVWETLGACNDGEGAHALVRLTIKRTEGADTVIEFHAPADMFDRQYTGEEIVLAATVIAGLKGQAEQRRMKRKLTHREMRKAAGGVIDVTPTRVDLP